MAIDVINSRNDIRAMRVNNLSTMKGDNVDKLAKDLNKRAYPSSQKKVYSFDEIERVLSQGLG